MAITSYEKKVRDKKDSTQFKVTTAYRYDERYRGIHIKASGFLSEPKARKALRYKKNEIDELHPDKASLELRDRRERQEKIMFENVLDDYFLYKKIYCKDINNIKSFFKLRITPFFKGMTLYKITESDVEKWQCWIMDLKHITRKIYKTIDGKKIIDEELSEYSTYSNSSLKNSHTYLNEFFKYAVKKKMIKTNPMANIKRVVNKNEIKPAMLYWTQEEFKRFINVVDDPLYNMLFNLLYWTGLRLGEALALNWTDIDLSNSTLRVNKTYDEKKHCVTTPKTPRSNRTVMISKTLLEGLKKHHDICEKYDGFNEKSFIFGIYTPIDDNTIRRRKNEYCAIARVKQIKLHGFRHSHVSLLINNRFTAFEIAGRIGDTENMVYSTYAHMFSTTQKNMVDFLNKIS